jgi:hypothetical protein
VIDTVYVRTLLEKYGPLFAFIDDVESDEYYRAFEAIDNWVLAPSVAAYWPEGSLRRLDGKSDEIRCYPDYGPSKWNKEPTIMAGRARAYGWGCLDFGEYPVYELRMADSPTELIGIVKISDSQPLDQWPVYSLNFEWTLDEYLGNFRQYMQLIAGNALKSMIHRHADMYAEVATHKKRLRRIMNLCSELIMDLRFFSLDVCPTAEDLEVFDFRNKAAELNDLISDDQSFLGTVQESMTLQSRDLRRWTLFAGATIEFNSGSINELLSKHTELLQEINAFATLLGEAPFCCQNLLLLSTKAGDNINFGMFASHVFATTVIGNDGFGCLEGATRFWALVMHPDCDGRLDKCPIYCFDVVTGKVLRGELGDPWGDYGNIRKWMERQLQRYLECVADNSAIVGNQEVEIVQRVAAMYDDLKYCSLEYVQPTKAWEEMAFKDSVVLM